MPQRMSSFPCWTVFVFCSDVKKARLLLKSVRETNPKHPPGEGRSTATPYPHVPPPAYTRWVAVPSTPTLDLNRAWLPAQPSIDKLLCEPFTQPLRVIVRIDKLTCYYFVLYCYYFVLYCYFSIYPIEEASIKNVKAAISFFKVTL